MSGVPTALLAHLQGGQTTLCRCWAILRRDGVRMAFTDHDLPLSFEGFDFSPGSGLTAYTLEQTTGLSVDNTEAMGALSDAAITEADIEAGRFDGAELRSWLVNWAAPEDRWLQFRGSLGELRRAGGAFQAELRGLSEALNVPQGRVYQKPCTAVLGDHSCGVDLTTPGYVLELPVAEVTDQATLRWPVLEGFVPDWFSRGRLSVLSGAAEGLWSAIKQDRAAEDGRIVTLWTPLRATVASGDLVRLTVGCDKRAETCRLKFLNFANFQGFPDIPGEDWLTAYPRSGQPNTGGSRR